MASRPAYPSPASIIVIIIIVTRKTAPSTPYRSILVSILASRLCIDPNIHAHLASLGHPTFFAPPRTRPIVSLCPCPYPSLARLFPSIHTVHNLHNIHNMHSLHSQNNWVQLLGHGVVEALATQCKVQLTPDVVTLLERFAHRVEKESRTRHQRRKRLDDAQHNLSRVSRVVDVEVSHLRQTLVHHREDRSSSLYVTRHAETYLPRVHLALRGLPTIVVDVPRAYATSRVGATYGLQRDAFCGQRRFTGRVATANNALLAFCRSRDWAVSVRLLLETWFNAVKDVPQLQRPQAENAHVDDPVPPLAGWPRRGAWNRYRLASQKRKRTLDECDQQGGQGDQKRVKRVNSVEPVNRVDRPDVPEQLEQVDGAEVPDVAIVADHLHNQPDDNTYAAEDTCEKPIDATSPAASPAAKILDEGNIRADADADTMHPTRDDDVIEVVSHPTLDDDDVIDIVSPPSSPPMRAISVAIATAATAITTTTTIATPGHSPDLSDISPVTPTATDMAADHSNSADMPDARDTATTQRRPPSSDKQSADIRSRRVQRGRWKPRPKTTNISCDTATTTGAGAVANALSPMDVTAETNPAATCDVK